MKEKLAERYIYAVTKKIPSSQRKDVGEELNGLIEEMIEAKNGDPHACEEVLEELGDPSLLAEKYRGHARYLIGPHYFDLYVQILKIVCIATAIGLGVALSIDVVFNAKETFGEVISHIVGTIFSAGFQIFAYVTLIFALIEWKQHPTTDASEKREWSFDDLPELPSQKDVITPSSSIASLVFYVILLALLNSSNWLMGLIKEYDNVFIINPFNPQVFKEMLLWINCTIVLSMGCEIARIIIGVRTKILVTVTISLQAISLMISIYIVRFSGIWNLSMASELADRFSFSPQTFDSFNRFWNFFPSLLVLLIILSFIIETIGSIWPYVKEKLIRKEVNV